MREKINAHDTFLLVMTGVLWTFLVSLTEIWDGIAPGQFETSNGEFECAEYLLLPACSRNTMIYEYNQVQPLQFERRRNIFLDDSRTKGHTSLAGAHKEQRFKSKSQDKND